MVAVGYRACAGLTRARARPRHLRDPEAFPVGLVTTRAVPGRSPEARAYVRVLRRAMRAFPRSPRFRATPAERGLLPSASALTGRRPDARRPCR